MLKQPSALAVRCLAASHAIQKNLPQMAQIDANYRKLVQQTATPLQARVGYRLAFGPSDNLCAATVRTVSHDSSDRIRLQKTFDLLCHSPFSHFTTEAPFSICFGRSSRYPSH
jgi:hypothetical protein